MVRGLTSHVLDEHVDCGYAICNAGSSMTNYERITLSFSKISYVVTSTLNFNFLFPG